ncbi:MAG: hypothetical protein GWN62_24870 [Aliifodinibius sp.]|nr:hypothetical protein [Fodinibius sp.]
MIGFAISEISFQLLKSDSRAPKDVKLTIPEGTSVLVSQGKVPPSIPEGMKFVVGDTLVVHNEDEVDHQLGPLWIPAGTTASMNLDRDQNFIFACTFQPSNYFGLDVREPVTIWTRLGGVVFSGVPLGAILALYSFITWPIEKPTKETNDFQANA